MFRACASVLSVVLSVSLQAQAGGFAGSVLQDTLGHGVAQAQVEIPDARRTTATDSRGNFAFSNIAPGRYAIVVRALGFELLVDTIAIAPGQRLEADIVLNPVPVKLAAVQTLDHNSVPRLPPGLQEMEERRNMHVGGYFVTDSMLRANDEKKLTYFLSRIPALRLDVNPPPALRATGAEVFLKGGHDNKPCYVEIFVDGAVYYKNPPSASNPPPDFNTLWANGYSGMEYYPSGSSIPAQYNGTHGASGDCGTMLLWTRRTP